VTELAGGDGEGVCASCEGMPAGISGLVGFISLPSSRRSLVNRPSGGPPSSDAVDFFLRCVTMP
jgi:hypothetical protein